MIVPVCANAGVKATAVKTANRIAILGHNNRIKREFTPFRKLKTRVVYGMNTCVP
jgi:hypothetical protein